LVQALEDASADGATGENAAQALGNLAAHDEDNKVAIVGAGTLPPW
jgi:hypothetical protein